VRTCTPAGEGRSIGKELLIDSNWHGTIELDDTEAMNRFKHYVGK
jgi:hypothetical protein